MKAILLVCLLSTTAFAVRFNQRFSQQTQGRAGGGSRPQDSAHQGNIRASLVPPQELSTRPPVPIVDMNFDMHDFGYKFNYEGENGVMRQEDAQVFPGEKEGEGSLVLRGEYSYIGDDGKTYTVQYVADERGFRPIGNHLPEIPDNPVEPDNNRHNQQFSSLPVNRPSPVSQQRAFTQPPVKQQRNFRQPRVNQQNTFTQPPVKTHRDFQQPHLNQQNTFNQPPTHRDFRQPHLSQQNINNQPPAKTHRDFRQPHLNQQNTFNQPPAQQQPQRSSNQRSSRKKSKGVRFLG